MQVTGTVNCSQQSVSGFPWLEYNRFWQQRQGCVIAQMTRYDKSKMTTSVFEIERKNITFFSAAWL